MSWLLDNGFTVEERDNDGNTALLFAAWGGHLDTMQLLIVRGAKLTEQNDNGHTLLLSASNGGRIHIIEWLLGKGFSLDETNHNGDTCLLLAAYGGHLDLLKWLVQRGVSLKQKNKCGFTPLLSAANGGQLNTARWLIEQGSSLAEADEDGYTPLILAACGGSIDLVKYFLSLGAVNTEVNNNGDTPLLLASYCGHTALVEWLLKNGSTLHEENNTSMGALISAANGGNVEVVQLLLKHIQTLGPDCGDGLESTDQGGYTPLLLAAQRGHLEIVRLLASAGANLQVRTTRFDNDARTLSRAYPDVAKYIEKIWEFDMMKVAAEAGMIDRVHELVQSASTSSLKGAQVVAAGTEHKDIKRLLRLALSPWSPARHQLFCITHGELVCTLLHVQVRLLGMDTLPFLPPEMWIHVASFFPRSQLEDTPPSPTTKAMRRQWRRKNSLSTAEDASPKLIIDEATLDTVEGEAAAVPAVPAVPAPEPANDGLLLEGLVAQHALAAAAASGNRRHQQGGTLASAL